MLLAITRSAKITYNTYFTVKDFARIFLVNCMALEIPCIPWDKVSHHHQRTIPV